MGFFSSDRKEFKANFSLELKGVFLVKALRAALGWAPKRTEMGTARVLVPACVAGSPVPALVQSSTSDLCPWPGT